MTAFSLRPLTDEELQQEIRFTRDAVNEEIRLTAELAEAFAATDYEDEELEARVNRQHERRNTAFAQYDEARAELAHRQRVARRRPGRYARTKTTWARPGLHLIEISAGPGSASYGVVTPEGKVQLHIAATASEHLFAKPVAR